MTPVRHEPRASRSRVKHSTRATAPPEIFYSIPPACMLSLNYFSEHLLYLMQLNYPNLHVILDPQYCILTSTLHEEREREGEIDQYESHIYAKQCG